MRCTAAWPLLAVLIVSAAAAACGAAAAEPLQLHLGNSRRAAARLLQAPVSSAAAAAKFGKNETIVPPTTDQNTGMACLDPGLCITASAPAGWLRGCSLSASSGNIIFSVSSSATVER